MTQGSNIDITKALRDELFDIFIEEDLPSSMKISNILAAEEDEFIRELAKFNEHSNEKIRELAKRAAVLLNRRDFNNIYDQLAGDVSDVELSQTQQALVDLAPTREDKYKEEEQEKRLLEAREAAKARPKVEPQPQVSVVKPRSSAPVPQVPIVKPSAQAPVSQAPVVKPSAQVQPKVMSEEERRNARHLPYLEGFVARYDYVKKSTIFNKAQELVEMEKNLKQYMADKSDVIRKKAVEVWNEMATKYSLGTKVEFKPTQLPPEKSVSPFDVNIEKRYNEQRKPKIPHKVSLSQFASKIKKNVVSTIAQNPARKKQVKALQELANQALQSGPEANERMLEYYSALHFIRSEIKKEKNRLPSALENVCKEMMSKIESSPEHFKKITEVYCKKYHLPENSGFNVKDLHSIAKEALKTSDTTKSKSDIKKKP